jgi:hypothetical protein
MAERILPSFLKSSCTKVIPSMRKPTGSQHPIRIDRKGVHPGSTVVKLIEAPGIMDRAVELFGKPHPFL